MNISGLVEAVVVPQLSEVVSVGCTRWPKTRMACLLAILEKL